MKRQLALMLCAVTLGVTAQLPDYVPTDSLVGWWSFESDFLDQSGNGNHGVPNGDVPFSSGLNGGDQSMSIDEAGSYVHLEGLDDFDFANESITFSAWVNWTGQFIGNEGDIIRYDDCSTSGYLWGVSLHQTTQTGVTNTLKAFDHNRFGADNGIEVNNTLPPVNQWTHVVCVRDVDLGTNQLFRDGVLIGQTSSITTPVPGADREMLLGICGGNGSTTFLGSIDECGIWNRALTVAEIQDLFSQEQTIYGCTNSAACNFSAEASSDDGSCTFGCQFCGVGTVWDESTETCIEDNTNGACDLVYDGNGDGVVGAADLLGLLTEFGAECTPETAFTCGDPVSYQGYDYATVLIGEQCWFAENLRSENYRNGVTIPSGLGGGFDEANEWGSTTDGAMVVYGEGPECNNSSPDIDACDPAQSLNEYGRLYNWYAVDDARGLCPSGWHVPMDEEWMAMEMALGMSEVEVNNAGYRGTDQGTQLRTTYGWSNGGNGTNSSGFSGLPGGVRVFSAQFDSGGYLGLWWTSSLDGSGAWHRQVNSGDEEVLRATFDLEGGLSVRCIKVSE